MTTIAIWAAAGPIVGGGHATRMIALAKALAQRDVRVMLFVASAAHALIADRVAGTPGITVMPIDGVESLRRSAELRGCSWLVIDDYAVEAGLESALREAGCRILAVDDLANRAHRCDALVDTMPYRRANAYAGLVPEAAALWIGLDYAMIGPELCALREASLARRRQADGRHCLLATFGLSRTSPGPALTLEALRYCDARLDATVLAADIPAAEELERKAEAIGVEATIRTPLTDPGPAFADADLVVGTPGVTTLELCALGVPMILLVTDPRQSELADAMVQRGAALRFDAGPLAAAPMGSAIATLMNSPRRLVKMSAAGAAAVDCGGARRVAELMLERV